MDYATFRVSGLECVIGNNAEAGEHRPGYNGVFSMRMPGVSDSAFVPAYAGLNLEHFFDARPRNEDRAIFMEPRHAPMTFTRSDEFTAELYQPPTPVYGVESWTRFQLREPNRIDMAFRCIPHKAVFEGGFMGVFWASYIQAPLDKSVYFLDAGSTLDKPQWVQYCTQVHGRDSTVLHEDAAEMPLPPMANDGSLFNSLSPLRYGEPFFYGRFRDQVLIYLFDDDPRIRFSHSPSGGGMTAAGDAANPAWDFQFVVSGYEVGREYGFRMSLIAKRWESREDVIAEVRNVMCQP
ncbi:MAG TPA: hypothetical protein PLO37_15515 [Candidatus Hydrogenedentes bacterium]|nr:hypothetical protein [Candidatus Hydrogenedentota bacterium]HPG68254.1 hypothetical protein [Candidatus Hydrogenedentota bacterium]